MDNADPASAHHTDAPNPNSTAFGCAIAPSTSRNRMSGMTGFSDDARIFRWITDDGGGYEKAFFEFGTPKLRKS
jgi:hypothetical protein